MKKFVFAIVVGMLFSFNASFAQGPDNWFNKDASEDGVTGVSTNKAYQLLKGKKSTPVIVAIIDSGVDIEHEDLADIIWVNEDEIPNNGKDDDKNGYIDDVHGWNFLGGANGKNVNEETLEITRLYRHYEKKFANANVKDLNGSQKKDYERYMTIKETFEKKRDELQGSVDRASKFFDDVEAGVKMFEKKGMELTLENVEALPESNDKEMGIKKALTRALNRDMDFSQLDEMREGTLNYYNGSLKHHYNADFNPRAEIVKDNFNDLYETGYGNNDAEGPDAGHGTHVGGIVGAIRGNDVGMDGIADNVKIMSIRAVPDGDETDKDVANAIRYAVDNGAKVINMSFGKGYSWDKKVVDDAVKYAAKNDVLLVHAAGNSSQDNDVSDNFPNDVYEDKFLFFKKRAKNWIEVGAFSWKPGEDMVASFSNYGDKQVDIFAPGYQIYSTVPQSDYATYSGTSMASPVVAGVASLLRSYFPDMSAKKVKKILLKSAIKKEDKVKLPGDPAILVPFKDLSKTGGVVNAYEAVKMAL